LSRPNVNDVKAGLQPFAFGRLRLSAQVMMQNLGEESILLDLRSENYFGLNRVATRAWQLLKESGDAADVYGRLLEEFDVEPARVAADLEALIQKLLDAGLIERDLTPPGSAAAGI
jgi:hypothetical protein